MPEENYQNTGIGFVDNKADVAADSNRPKVLVPSLVQLVKSSS